VRREASTRHELLANAELAIGCLADDAPEAPRTSWSGRNVQTQWFVALSSDWFDVMSPWAKFDLRGTQLRLQMWRFRVWLKRVALQAFFGVGFLLQLQFILVGLLVGLHDLTQISLLTVRLLAIALVLSSCFVVYCLPSTRPSGARHRGLMLAGLVVSGGWYLIFLAAASPYPQMLDTIRVVAVELGIQAALMGYLVLRGVRLRLSATRTKIFAGVATLGLVSASLQFLYNSVYLPETAPARMNVDITLARETLVRDASAKEVIPVVLRYQLRNVGSRPAMVIESNYNIYGIKTYVRETIDREKMKDRARSAGTSEANGEYETYNEKYDSDVVGFGRLMTQGNYLGPGDTITQQVVVYVPPGLYDQVRAFVTIDYMNRLSFRHVEQYDSSVDADEFSDVGTTKYWWIDDGSAIHQLVSGGLYVQTYWTPTSASARVGWGLPDDFKASRRAEDALALASFGASTELALSSGSAAASISAQPRDDSSAGQQGP
jgi:hypothetical protein